VAECWCPETALKPSLFGRVPVVYFEPPDGPAWKCARGVRCDEAAVAEMAFRELSAGNPPAYAVLSCWKRERWARERIDAFRECCRKAGADCRVSYFLPGANASECPSRFNLMVPWAAALPRRCAVFAVNDCCARCAAKAMSAAGRSFPRSATLVGADGAESPQIKEVQETVSSVRLDHELAGYLAAKALCAFAANDAAPSLPASRASSLRAQPAPSLIFPPLLVDRRKSTRGYGRREPRILEAMEIIRREACDGLTVSALARRFRGTRRLFDMRFREAAGHSALDEIMNVRMARAMELLSGTDMPVSAVADFCGFNTELAFWKVFRRRVGVAPLEFRRARK
jgi:LacI family transcriptional regulator